MQSALDYIENQADTLLNASDHILKMEERNSHLRNIISIAGEKSEEKKSKKTIQSPK